jgi:hypothetical protein
MAEANTAKLHIKDKSSTPLELRSKELLLAQPEAISDGKPFAAGAEGFETKLEPEIIAPTTPSPTLVGRIVAGTLSGAWGMTREAAVSGDTLQTSKFEYQYNSELEIGEVRPPSGDYSGHFYLQVPGRATPIKVVENAMKLEFTSNAAGRLNVRGQGKNCYGPFTISGTCAASGNDIELVRVYAQQEPMPIPKKTPTIRKPSGKDLSRVQAALSKSHDHGGTTSRAHSRKAGTVLAPVVSTSSASAEAEGKRSVRARKMPSHLCEGTSIDASLSKGSSSGFPSTDTLKRCHAVVTSLERSPGADWFSAPVDAVALGVPHYSAIIDAPMDLRTVKHNLDRGVYTDPHVFAADIRLVFRNAMTFNILPEAAVHESARDLHTKFEDQLKTLWKHLASTTITNVKAKVGGFKRDADVDLDSNTPKRGKFGGKKSGKSKNVQRDDDYGSVPCKSGMVPVADLVSMQRQMESMQATIAALQKQASQTEVQVQMNMELGLGATPSSGYAASKATRIKPLTFDEKEALSNDINALPPDKLAHVVKIVQESMPLTGRHDDDEIEVDIETLDNDTLRDLQKYVKASLGKKRAHTKKKSQQALQPPELSLTSDERTLASVAFGASGLGPGFDSDEDEDELAYDVLNG